VKNRPPNIVIIFTDDQGYADIGVYGAQGFQTPNLDRLANEGIRFTDFQVSQAVCSASRAALLTGSYSERVGVQGAFNHTARVGLNPDEETIAEMLKSIGYVTGIFGKWHLGHHKKFLPLQQGFDEYLGIPYSNDMWPVDYDGSSVSGTDHFKSFYPQLPLIEDNEKIEEIRTLDDQDQLTTRYTERAVDFITNNKDRPFFLYLPHSMPHVPLGVSNKFRNKSEQGMYGDVIMEIDWSVGEILNALSDNDLDDNTVVIFTSDNGPWLNYGNHAGSAFPLREGKGTMWEGGSRVPCIIRWPGRITAGSVSHQLAATIDILPTIASITGAALPARPIDGVSIQAILEGDTSATPREEYYYYYGGELIAVRKGKMKLVFPHSYRSYAGIEPGLDGYPGIYKDVLGKYAVGKSKLELYDLDNDMSESKDVSEMYPDVVKTLQVLGQKAREELGDRLTGTIGTGVRPIGRLDPERSPSYLEVSHKAVNRPVTIKNQYSEKYSAGGDNGVVNGIRGTIDFHDGNWQGYEGVDFEAIIDLGETTVLSEISSSFLQNQSAWIFFPTEVEFEISTNGFDFSSVKRVHYKTKISPSHEVINFSHVFSQEKARFVKVKAKNITICPDWHPGAGGEAWIFLDEIVVK
jgi:arylsulfatase